MEKKDSITKEKEELNVENNENKKRIEELNRSIKLLEEERRIERELSEKDKSNLLLEIESLKKSYDELKMLMDKRGALFMNDQEELLRLACELQQEMETTHENEYKGITEVVDKTMRPIEITDAKDK